jgi:hypothetical protein
MKHGFLLATVAMITAATWATANPAASDPAKLPWSTTSTDRALDADLASPDSLGCFIQVEGDSGDGVNSQNYEASLDIYDSMAAADVRRRKTCRVRLMDVYGQYFPGSGPARSETVTFYSDAGGRPGAVYNTQTVVGVEAPNFFQIPLSQVNLLGHVTYWVSVQVNMDFETGGEWGWETTTLQKGAPAQWQNPLDGFGTGCTTWQSVQTCLGSALGPELMFALSK